MVDFAAKHMKKNPDITMSELKKLGASEGHNIYPLILGLARKQLGWGRGVGTKKATKKKRVGRPRGSTNAAPVTRKKGRRKQSSVAAMGGADATAALSGIVAHVEELEGQVRAMREALAQIADIASSV